MLRWYRHAATVLVIGLAACGGGGGSDPGPPAAGDPIEANTAPGEPLEPTLHDVQASPYAIWEDELSNRAITVTARATSMGDAGLELSYFDGLVGGTGARITEPMFDDGTHGDEVPGDGIWTRALRLEITAPHGLRYYDGTVDRISLSIQANEDEPSHPIGANLDVAVLSRALERDAPARVVGPSAMVTDTMVNIVDPGFDGGGLSRITEKLYELIPGDPFDFVVVFHTRTTGDGVPRSVGVKNDIDGINLGTYDYTAAYGSAGNLEQVVFQNGSIMGLEINHELGHRWAAFLDDPALNLAVPTGFHWGPSDHVGQMGNGPYLLADDSGGYLVTNGEDSEKFIVNPFSRLELYLMGLVPPAEVPPYRFVTDPSVDVSFGAHLPASATRVVTIDDIVEVYGERAPAARHSPIAFTAAFVVVSDRFLTEAEYTLTSTIARYAAGVSIGGERSGGLFDVLDPPSFSAATGFRATLETVLPLVSS